MTARSRMTQRAVVERDTQVLEEDSGNPGEPTWSVHATVPCWIYTSAGREAVDEDRVAVVTDLRMMVPLGTDVTERDRVTSVADRLGAEILAGRMDVRSVLPKRDHVEVLLDRVTA